MKIILNVPLLYMALCAITSQPGTHIREVVCLSAGRLIGCWVVNLSFRWLVGWSVGRSIGFAVGSLVGCLVGLPVSWLVTWLACRSTGRLVSCLVCLSAGRLIGCWVVNPSFRWLFGWSVCRSVVPLVDYFFGYLVVCLFD